MIGSFSILERERGERNKGERERWCLNCEGETEAEEEGERERLKNMETTAFWRRRTGDRERETKIE